jgi:hypothetical protein
MAVGSITDLALHTSYRTPTPDWKEKMKLEKRIRLLEAKLSMGQVVLRLADGTTRELHGPSDFLVRLLRGVCGRADLGASQREQLELIRQSVGSKEHGGGRMVELIQCLLRAQADALENV